MPRGEKTKLLWQNPKYRKHILKVCKNKRMTGKHHSEKSKRKMGRAIRKRWQNSEFREKMKIVFIGCRNKGSKHWNWKKGNRKDRGYIYILKPEHPFAIKSGYVRRSRLIMEKQIGRYLTPEEIVHHINETTDDDRIENFILFKNRAFHRWFHKKGFCNPKGIIFDGEKIK